VVEGDRVCVVPSRLELGVMPPSSERVRVEGAGDREIEIAGRGRGAGAGGVALVG